MAVGSPKASSTPKVIPNLKARPPIRDNESFQSPIREECSGQDSQSGLESDEETDEEVSNRSNEDREKETLSGGYIGICGIFILLPLFSLWFVDIEETPNNSSSPNHISEELFSKFPSQGRDFWLNIQVAINDIKDYEQPKCIIFLHESDTKETLEKILFGISSVAISELTSSAPHPLILTPGDINTEDNLRDYGKIITNNRDLLENHRVMIVKNLDFIRGISAQAFHSFCDEYTPVVKKALFLFTVNVGELPTQPTKFLRNYLRERWNDLHEDKFVPLFTRISTSILSISKE